MDSSFVDPSTALGILGGVGVFVFAIYYMIFMNRQEDNFDKVRNDFRGKIEIFHTNSDQKSEISRDYRLFSLNNRIFLDLKLA